MSTLHVRMLWLVLFGLAAAVGAEDRRPNVIVILTDDQGAVDLGAWGATDLVTPNMDRLARDGVRFTQFYAAAAICSPSRAALLTGQYPWEVGVPDNAPAPPSEGVTDINSVDGPNALAADALTLAEMLKGAGYATGHIGKWHLGWGRESRPRSQGFDYSFGHLGGCIDNYSHFFYWNGPNRHDLWEDGRRVRRSGAYFPDLMVEKAEAFMKRHRDRPFFLYYACNQPHYPYQGDERWLKRYAGAAYPRNIYAASLSSLDDRIGRLLDIVEELRLRENTIVIFQSDQGHSVEERAHRGGGDNGPYRGCKFSLFEGGIRVPAMISWPGHLPANTVRDQMAHSCDWLPTIAELCGVTPPAGRSFRGSSLAPVIRDAAAPSPHATLVWRMGDQRAVRRGPWKLIRNVRNPAGDGPALSDADRKWFLANVAEDPGETRNLAAAEPKLLSELKALLDD
ncbi:MAG TPA: sulfatase-like hydrolase/transferase [Phycisphaerae bacterium]|nr:sulfatase-like hydrolase/transferase [Phycisphaerae bacterium]